MEDTLCHCSFSLNDFGCSRSSFLCIRAQKAIFRDVYKRQPAYRCRAVEGPKKINKVVIKVSDPLEIEYLLARDDHQAKAIFQGEKGYAFETISPENGLILMHAEDDLSTLKTCLLYTSRCV